MSMPKRSAALVLAALAPLGVAWGANPGGYTLEFPIASCDWSSTGGNAFLKLKVNRQLYLSNKACKECVEEDGLEELWITILPETRVVTFPYGGQDAHGAHAGVGGIRDGGRRARGSLQEFRRRLQSDA